MLKNTPAEPDAFGKGAYGAVESLRLLDFNRPGLPPARRLSRQTVTRWLRGYTHGKDGQRHSEPLWKPDYQNEGDQIELSFRDLIELRFVKAFRDLGVGLNTIRECYRRAVSEIHDDRPFSTQRFRTDGKTIFLEITEKDHDGHMIDLKKRQQVFRTIIEPSLTATAFLSNLDIAETIGDYDQTVREVLKSIGALPPSAFNNAERVVDAILQAVDADTRRCAWPPAARPCRRSAPASAPSGRRCIHERRL